jgi:hypothetical protein
MSARTDVTAEVIDLRMQIYGHPIDTFTRIAHAWSAVLDHEIQPYEVPLLLLTLKVIRTQQCPDYSDNSDDIEGYLDIFRTLVGPDMVHARTVQEYIDKKNPKPDESWTAHEIIINDLRQQLKEARGES